MRRSPGTSVASTTASAVNERPVVLVTTPSRSTATVSTRTPVWNSTPRSCR